MSDVDLSWVDEFVPSLDGQRVVELKAAREAGIDEKADVWRMIGGHPVKVSGGGGGGGHSGGGHNVGGEGHDEPLKARGDTGAEPTPKTYAKVDKRIVSMSKHHNPTAIINGEVFQHGPKGHFHMAGDIHNGQSVKVEPQEYRRRMGIAMQNEAVRHAEFRKGRDVPPPYGTE